MRRLIIRKAAERDLNAILEHIAFEGGSVPIAHAFANRLRERCVMLAALPGTLGRAREELRPGLRSVPEGKYLIFFRYSPGIITIVNIIHSARNLRRMFPRP